MNTQKYEKLESYSRVDAAKKKAMEGIPEEQSRRSQEAVRCAEGAHLPRRDAQGAPPSRRPQVRRSPQDRSRSGRAAAYPRLGSVHPRRNAGSGHGHARHQGRRAAHRAAGFFGNLQALHAALQLPAVQRRRSGLHARRGPPRNRARSTGRARRRGRGSRRQDLPLHHAHRQRHHGIERFELHGVGVRRERWR